MCVWYILKIELKIMRYEVVAVMRMVVVVVMVGVLVCCLVLCCVKAIFYVFFTVYYTMCFIWFYLFIPNYTELVILNRVGKEEEEERKQLS